MGEVTLSKEEAAARIQQERDACAPYKETANTVIQLSTGALALSVTFAKEVFAGSSGELSLRADWVLLVAWVLWLVAILLGGLYQYVLGHYLERMANNHGLLYYARTWKVHLPEIIRDNPYLVFGGMTGSFAAGTVTFFLYAVFRLLL